MDWTTTIEKENISKAEDLTKLLGLSPEQEKKLAEILEHFPMAITKHYLSLIDFNDPDDPIKKMCIPSIEETDLSGAFDTSGEASNTVIAGMQHKYKETALILSTNRCAMYCRHCFRKRLVGTSDKEIAKNIPAMVEYIEAHKEISNVLVSGGDSFLNSNQTIEYYLESLSKIEHLDFIRFGTRVPVVLPTRITKDQELQHILKKYNEKKQIYVVTQFNHPKELCPEAIEAVRCLKDMGIIVKNQTVLLKGINDAPAVLGDLLRQMSKILVPYYIFQCRPVSGVKNQFQVPIEKGLEIVEKAKSMQNGQGKAVRYAMSHETGKIEIVGKLNGEMIFKYHQAKDPADFGRIFTKKLREDQCWLD